MNKRGQCTACGVNYTVGVQQVGEIVQFAFQHQTWSIFLCVHRTIFRPVWWLIAKFLAFYRTPWLQKCHHILNLVFRGCSIPLWGSISKSSCLGRITGVAMRRFDSCGHQACVGHRGTTIWPSAPSLSNFFRHLAIKQKGGSQIRKYPCPCKGGTA